MEIPAKQFYIHQRYENVYYYTYLALEDWITDNIFREDSSRVFLASDEYAFRRRFELTDMSKDYAEIDLTSLRFPFANYWPLNSGWMPDRRVAAQTAKLVYDGIYEGSTKIKAISSIISIPTTFYFDREDDARIAYEILYFKSFNEHYYQQEMPFGDSVVKIPISMEIKDIQFNPQFKEEDWLKQQRIFVIKVNIELRSFVIQPPNQPRIDLDLTSDGYLSDGSIYDDGVARYPTVTQVDLRTDPTCHYLKDGKDIWLSTLSVDGVLIENNVKLNQLFSQNIDESTVKLIWKYADNSQENVRSIKLDLNNGLSDIIIDPAATSYIITGLSPNYVYNGWMTIIDIQGKPKRFGIRICTEAADSPNIVVSEEDKKAITPSNSLVGFSW